VPPGQDKDMTVESETLVDLEVLAQYVGSNPILLREVSQKFLLSARQTIEQMRHAAESELHDQVASLAHRLKPSVRAMGATRMTEHLQQLELAAEEKCSEAIDKQLAHLTPILARLEHEIAALV
jgi:HPt (histidine-containing phosphotransfer) domain-containing protein